MAGRFVLQRLASGMSRSTSRLSAHASAASSARATAPVIPRASAARYLNSSAAAKAGWSTTGLPPSSIINQKKPAFVGSVGGVKRTCSSAASNKLEHSWGAKRADWRARFDAWLVPNEPAEADDLATCVWKVGLVSAFTAFCLVGPWPSDQRKSGNNGLIARHCPTCKCLSVTSKS